MSEGGSTQTVVPNLRNETEVLIVGGGPAGLAAAIALRQRGVDCVVVEAGGPGIDKACGEGLMPDTLASLRSLGVEMQSTDGHAIRGIRFANTRHSVQADFPDGAGLGVRRPQLHRALAARAEAAGALVLWNSYIKLPERGPDAAQTVQVNGQPLRYRWLVGADGHASSVRRWAGLDTMRRESIRFGFRMHYRMAPWSDRVEVYWAKGSQLYVTPVAADCVCIVLLVRDRRCDRSDLAADFPEVAARLRGAETISQQRGAVAAMRVLRRVAEGRVVLLGDASGSADPITGAGMAMGFRQAHALAEAIVGGSLTPYAQAHTRIGRLPHSMGTLMLTLDRWPALEARSMRALAAHPEVFGELLAAHVGTANLAKIALRHGLQFGWDMAWPTVCAPSYPAQ